MQSTRSSQRILLHHNEIEIHSSELANIICYPQFSMEEYSQRLSEISSFGVTHFIPTGRTRIGKITTAGKGCVSIVLKARTNDRICALKIRRTDANRHTMKREVSLHKIANSAGVGPILFDSSDNLIAMEFIDGLSIVNWIKKEDTQADEVHNLAVSALEQCYQLDTARIDHGQLSCLNHHLIVSKSNGTIKIIDFESSSTQRKPSNVTTAAQSLFLSGLISTRINQLIKIPPREQIIQVLKSYKWNQNRANFDNIVALLS